MDQRSNSINRKARFLFFVRIVGDDLSVQCHRVPWLVTNRRQARHGQPQSRRQRLQQEVLPVLLKRDPCVAFTIVASSAHDKSSRKIHVEQLSPCPQRIVFTVTSFDFLKFVRGLPIIRLVIQLLVRNIPKLQKGFAQFGKVGAPMFQRRACVESKGKGRTKSAVTPGVRAKSLFPGGVVALRDNFSYQGVS